MNDLTYKAVSIGFSYAALMEDLSIECEPRLRAYCRIWSTNYEN